MKEAKVKWQTNGVKTTICCFEVGNYFFVLEHDRESGEVTKIGETFSLVEAWDMYYSTVDARVRKVLWEQDKARRPKDKKGLVAREGFGHITDLSDPFIGQLDDDFRAGRRIRWGDALTEQERRDFDRLVLAFFSPELPKQILDTMK